MLRRLLPGVLIARRTSSKTKRSSLRPPTRRSRIRSLRSRRNKLLFAFLLAAVLALGSGPGFRSRGQFEAHYRKHGAEFGRISKEQYLSLAQDLRDAPAGKEILQSVRADRVVTKFDRRKGYFGAYN